MRSAPQRANRFRGRPGITAPRSARIRGIPVTTATSTPALRSSRTEKTAIREADSRGREPAVAPRPGMVHISKLTTIAFYRVKSSRSDQRYEHGMDAPPPRDHSWARGGGGATTRQRRSSAPSAIYAKGPRRNITAPRHHRRKSRLFARHASAVRKHRFRSNLVHRDRSQRADVTIRDSAGLIEGRPSKSPADRGRAGTKPWRACMIRWSYSQRHGPVTNQAKAVPRLDASTSARRKSPHRRCHSRAVREQL